MKFDELCDYILTEGDKIDRLTGQGYTFDIPGSTTTEREKGILKAIYSLDDSKVKRLNNQLKLKVKLDKDELIDILNSIEGVLPLSSLEVSQVLADELSERYADEFASRNDDARINKINRAANILRSFFDSPTKANLLYRTDSLADEEVPVDDEAAAADELADEIEDEFENGPSEEQLKKLEAELEAGDDFSGLSDIDDEGRLSRSDAAKLGARFGRSEYDTDDESQWY